MLRIGILIDNDMISSYDYQLCEKIITSELFHKPIVIKCKDESQKAIIKHQKQKGFFKTLLSMVLQQNNIKEIIEYISISIILKIELPKVRKIFPRFATKRSIKELSIEEIEITKQFCSQKKLKWNINLSDLNKLKERNLDCFLRCGTDIISGDILELTKHGIISFHHGDNRINRGGPPGFWEVFNREFATGFIIQRLSEELDGGKVLFRGSIQTKEYWLLNQAFLSEKSNIYILKLLENLALNNFSLIKQENDPCIFSNQEIYKLNTKKLQRTKYLLKVYLISYCKRLLKAINKRGRYLVERWSIGYSTNSCLNTALFRYKEIKNPPYHFLADPFVNKKNGQTMIFVEDYSYIDCKGRISAIEIKNQEYNYLGTVLEEDYHLSFPFIFEEGGEIYMIPESSKNKDIRLYKCIDYPKKWEFLMTLMTNISAVDTMLIKRDGTWYMLTNVCSIGMDDHNSELHIFYSEDIFTTNWLPINEGNPVIFDANKARNAGLVVHEERIYRVNQTHSYEKYGKCFQLNEIIALNHDEYKERFSSEARPSYFNDLTGTHHMHNTSEISVIDFSRNVYLPSPPKKNKQEEWIVAY